MLAQLFPKQARLWYTCARFDNLDSTAHRSTTVFQQQPALRAVASNEKLAGGGSMLNEVAHQDGAVARVDIIIKKLLVEVNA